MDVHRSIDTASNPSPDSESLTALKDLVECPIHRGPMEWPKLLPCSHAFCLACLERWRCEQQPVEADDGSPSGDRITCPVCRSVVSVVGYSGLRSLPSSAAHQAVLDYLLGVDDRAEGAGRYRKRQLPVNGNRTADASCVFEGDANDDSEEEVKEAWERQQSSVTTGGSRTQLMMRRHCRYRVTELALCRADGGDLRVDSVAPVLRDGGRRLAAALLTIDGDGGLVLWDLKEAPQNLQRLPDVHGFEGRRLRLSCLQTTASVSDATDDGPTFYAIARTDGDLREALVLLSINAVVGSGDAAAQRLLAMRRFASGCRLGGFQADRGGSGLVAVTLPDWCAIDLLPADLSTAGRRITIDGLRPRHVAWAPVGRHSNSQRGQRLWIASSGDSDAEDEGTVGGRRLTILDVANGQMRRARAAMFSRGPLTTTEGPDGRVLVVEDDSPPGSSGICWTRDQRHVAYLQRLHLSRPLPARIDGLAAAGTSGRVLAWASSGNGGGGGDRGSRLFCLEPLLEQRLTQSERRLARSFDACQIM